MCEWFKPHECNREEIKEIELKANIIIIIVAVCVIFVFSYYYFYQKHNINLKVIVITNLYIFAISGIIEYILMNFMIKKELIEFQVQVCAQVCSPVQEPCESLREPC